MFTLPPSVKLQIVVDEAAEASPVTIDLLEAYDQAAFLAQSHGDAWLPLWGEWIATQLGQTSLAYSQVRSLWQQVAHLSTTWLDDCKKKAETTAF
ncbi:hypothetical protein [Bremerella cremea]|uniref:hypothetical protein n=1 Tax=Bremerella cremea TaxID=1031537 RepID=UPI0031E5D4D6